MLDRDLPCGNLSGYGLRGCDNGVRSKRDDHSVGGLHRRCDSERFDDDNVLWFGIRNRVRTIHGNAHRDLKHRLHAGDLHSSIHRRGCNFLRVHNVCVRLRNLGREAVPIGGSVATVRKLVAMLLLCCAPVCAQGIGGKAGIGGSAGIGGGSTTGAAFVNSTSCTSTNTTTCTISGLSIPSGDLIVTGVGGTFTSASPPTIADSNSDTQSCGSVIQQTTNNNAVYLCVAVAGTTVTTVSCTIANSNLGTICIAAWYTPGSLLGVADQGAGANEAGVLNWNTGTTGTLSGSRDLVVGFWGTASASSITSTYSDGGTQRISTLIAVNFTVCTLEDRNVSGTSGVAASGTFNLSGVYAAVAVLAIK